MFDNIYSSRKEQQYELIQTVDYLKLTCDLIHLVAEVTSVLFSCVDTSKIIKNKNK